MPTPGPRTQFGPVPGYTNPGRQHPDRFNRWDRPPPVAMLGETPGLMYVTRNVRILGAGLIRRFYRQSVNYIPAPAPYSWTANGPTESAPPAVGVTRALRYMTRCVYVGSGIDNTRLSGLHTQVLPAARQLPVTIGAGQTRSRPTVRNRMSSFGSRVPTLNQPVAGAVQE